MLILFFYQVEMTGDYTPDLMALSSADIIISTPEKWDGISRNWHSRSYVTKVCCFLVWAIIYWQFPLTIFFFSICKCCLTNIQVYLQVGLLILDEIHLLGADRGPILEVFIFLYFVFNIAIAYCQITKDSSTPFVCEVLLITLGNMVGLHADACWMLLFLTFVELP